MEEATQLMFNRNYFGVMMVETGQADAFLSGFTSKYADTIRPALQIIGTNNPQNHIAGTYVLITKKGPFFFADCTVNIDPSAQTLVDTTLLTYRGVKKYNIEPRIVLLSFSNFGDNRNGSPEKVREAVDILHRYHPEIIVDGKMQANFALNTELRMKKFPFSKLRDMEVNTLVFPDLNASNIAYKMMAELAGVEIIGPILLGIAKPVHVLHMESSVREIVNMAAISVIDVHCLADDECRKLFG